MSSRHHALARLCNEWSDFVATTTGRDALTRWSTEHPRFAGMADLDDLLRQMLDPPAAMEILPVLARLAITDIVAARTLLQAMLPRSAAMTARRRGVSRCSNQRGESHAFSESSVLPVLDIDMSPRTHVPNRVRCQSPDRRRAC